MDTSEITPTPHPPEPEAFRDQSPALPRAAGQRWRLAAAALAGGVLAAAVAVPVTAQLATTAMADAPSPDSPETSTSSDTSPFGSGLEDDREPTAPGGSTDGYGYGSPFGDQPATGDTSGTSSQSAATAAESAGLVLIDTTLADGTAAGTGMVLDADGLVLTNYHVVEDSTSVEVTVASAGDGTARTYEAVVVGSDESADVALLQLDDASDLQTVAIDDDGGAVVGDTITAVGNSEGQGSLSAAAGTVTAIDQDITTSDATGAVDEDLAGLLRLDAYVVPGDSGGAVLDDEGEVVGVTTAASSSGRSVGYAVPIDDALDVVAQIESGREGDGVQIGPAAYLGVSIDTSAPGVTLADVEDDGGAAAAGLVAGDTITALDGSPVTSVDDLTSALSGHEPSDSVEVQLTDASGDARSVTVVLGSSPLN